MSKPLEIATPYGCPPASIEFIACSKRIRMTPQQVRNLLTLQAGGTVTYVGGPRYPGYNLLPPVRSGPR